LVDVAGRFDASGGQIPALQAAPELAARAKAALDRAQSSEAERLELQRELAGLRSEQARAASAVETQRRALLELGAAHGVDATDPVPELASLAASATESLASVRLQLDDTTASYNELRGRLNEEARDDEMTRARQQLEGVRARAAVAADSYLVDAVAVHLLDRARERFEADRQPEVVRTAARVFSAMTDGQYVDVRMPLDGSEIVVVGKNGVAKTATELSRGTAEQLYLALRVGLIGSLGELGRWLPVLMDDVIVNFDDDRRIWAATAVREIAASRQVLFFTCHPEIADLLARRVDGAQLVKLPRCELRG
jgi:uncharacterized protein YhaN